CVQDLHYKVDKNMGYYEQLSRIQTTTSSHFSQRLTWFAVGGHLSEGPVARGGEVGQAPPGENVGGRLGRRARVAFGGQPSRAAGVDGRDRFGDQAGDPVVDQERPLWGGDHGTGFDVAVGGAGPVDGGERRGATGQQDQ